MFVGVVHLATGINEHPHDRLAARKSSPVQRCVALLQKNTQTQIMIIRRQNNEIIINNKIIIRWLTNKN